MPRPHINEIIPRTFRLYDKAECEAFFATAAREGLSAERNNIFILKPTHQSNGRGMRIISTDEEMPAIREEFLQSNGECKHDPAHAKEELGVIAQQYIANPLLLEGRKSETRAYWVVVCTDPWIVLYRQVFVLLIKF